MIWSLVYQNGFCCVRRVNFTNVSLQVGSPTAFADAALEVRMRRAAAQFGLYVPSGAFWGGEDIRKMADRGTLQVSSRSTWCRERWGWGCIFICPVWLVKLASTEHCVICVRRCIFVHWAFRRK